MVEEFPIYEVTLARDPDRVFMRGEYRRRSDGGSRDVSTRQPRAPLSRVELTVAGWLEVERLRREAER